MFQSRLNYFVFGIAAFAVGFLGTAVHAVFQVNPVPFTPLNPIGGAPIGFALLSLLYFKRFACTTPLETAAAFLAVVVAMDAFLVAPVFERSYAMFASPLGTWIPFALIFAATYLTGLAVARRPPV